MDWKERRKDEIEKLWHQRSGFGLAAICATCKGSSISTCDCAKRSFYDRLESEDDLNQLIEEDKKEEESAAKMMAIIKESLGKEANKDF